MAVSDSIDRTEPGDPIDAPVPDWQLVPPVRGFWRPLDRFFGPGMTAREWVVLWLGVAVGCGGVAILWVHADAHESFSSAALVWAFIATFDVLGGIMTLSSNSGKRWYNSPIERARRARLSFLGIHSIHLAIVSFLVLPGSEVPLGFEPWWWFTLNVAVLYGLGLTIELVGLDIQRPVAASAFMLAVMVNLIAVPLPLEMSFFVPLFFLKLFICYLPIESPWCTRPPAPPVDTHNRVWRQAPDRTTRTRRAPRV